MVRNRFAQIRDRFAKGLHSIRNRFAKVLDGCATDSHKFARVHTRYSRIRDRFADSQWIRGFAMGFADSRRFATDSRKSSTRFVQIRDKFAADSRIRTHDSHKFARIRDGYYTVLRGKMCVKSPSRHPSGWVSVCQPSPCRDGEAADGCAAGDTAIGGGGFGAGGEVGAAGMSTTV